MCVSVRERGREGVCPPPLTSLQLEHVSEREAQEPSKHSQTVAGRVHKGDVSEASRFSRKTEIVGFNPLITL